MLSHTHFVSVSLVHFLIYTVQAKKVKSYSINKYSTSETNFDCPHTTKANITIPQEFSFCFRHKQLRPNNAAKWSSVFFGNLHENWIDIKIGIEFGIFASVPWVGLHENGKTVWVAVGTMSDFDMLTWRHSCLTISFVDGHSMMYENGNLLSEDKFDEYIQFKDKMPASVSILVLVCVYVAYKESHP